MPSKFRSLRRPERSRSPRPRLLIVTEDSVSTPRYFAEIRFEYSLPPAQVVIRPSPGSDPMSVVNCLCDEWEDEARGLAPSERPFDRAYAVIDRDAHTNLAPAREKIRQKNENLREKYAADEDLMCLALSEPCFEFWILLHFEYTRHPFARTYKKSPCDSVISRLRSNGLSGYSKGMNGLWSATKQLLETAFSHAERARQDARGTGASNPSTDVDRVVRAIIDAGKKL